MVSHLVGGGFQFGELILRHIGKADQLRYFLPIKIEFYLPMGLES
jgi:hypothetical protein